MQRPEDGSGLWGLEALPADGVEQAHSGECQPHTALWPLSSGSVLCTSESHPLGPCLLVILHSLWAFLRPAPLPR